MAAVAAYEPTIIPVMREDDSVRRGAMYKQFGAAAAERRLADAARTFHGFLATDSEMAALDADYFERCAAVVPTLLQDVQGAMAYQGPRSTDHEVFGKVTAPVLLLRGQQTQLDTFYTDTVLHVAEHVADPHVREPLPGLGHWAPLVAPEPIATELISFFESVAQLASDRSRRTSAKRRSRKSAPEKRGRSNPAPLPLNALALEPYRTLPASS